MPIATDFKTQPNRQIYAERERYYCYPVFVALLLACISAWHVMRTDWLVGLVDALVYITTFTLCNAFNGLCSWFMSLLVDFWSSEKKLLGHSETALPCVLGTCTWLEFWRLGFALDPWCQTCTFKEIQHNLVILISTVSTSNGKRCQVSTLQLSFWKVDASDESDEIAEATHCPCAQALRQQLGLCVWSRRIDRDLGMAVLLRSINHKDWNV